MAVTLIRSRTRGRVAALAFMAAAVGIGCSAASSDPPGGSGGNASGSGGTGAETSGGSGGDPGTGGVPPTGGTGGVEPGTGGTGATGGEPTTGGSGGVPGVGGTGGSGTGGDGGAGATPATLVPPIDRGATMALEFEGYLFEVSPQVGGRVVTFSYQGVNVLSGSAVNATNYGSTFWTSPQSAWNWPPPTEIDSAAYTATVEENTIVLTGAPNATLGLSVTKRFTPDLARRAIVMDFTIHNHGAAAASAAAWQISRVAGGGLTFFPTGEEVSLPNLPVTQSEGITWYPHDLATVPAGGDKYIADGSEGWLAHVAGDLLLLKAFMDQPAAAKAPGEGEIELYANKAAQAAQAYVEVEPQGPYLSIPPQGSTTWTVTWYLRSLPAELPRAPSAELAAFTRSVLQ